MLIGLIERSSSRLVCQLFKDDPQGRPIDERRLATHPGTLVAFNGDKLWHSITPLGENEERVSLTLEYVTDPSMHPLKRLFSNLKDSFAYCAEALKGLDDQKAISSDQMSNALLHLVVHNNEIYGNIVGYLRVSGIVPPSTAARGSQKGKKN